MKLLLRTYRLRQSALIVSVLSLVLAVAPQALAQQNLALV